MFMSFVVGYIHLKFQGYHLAKVTNSTLIYTRTASPIYDTLSHR